MGLAGIIKQADPRKAIAHRVGRSGLEGRVGKSISLKSGATPESDRHSQATTDNFARVLACSFVALCIIEDIWSTVGNKGNRTFTFRF